MIVVGKGHVLRGLGFTRKTLGADTHMESVCGQRGLIRDGEMQFFYPQVMVSDVRLLQEAVACATCKQLLGV